MANAADVKIGRDVLVKVEGYTDHYVSDDYDGLRNYLRETGQRIHPTGYSLMRGFGCQPIFTLRG